MTTLRTVNVKLTNDEARYILHSLREFKKNCASKVEEDLEGDDERTHMYANDILEAQQILDKLEAAAVPVFGENKLEVSYELL